MNILILSVFFWILFSPLLAGTGVGSSFVHQKNKPFDFHLAHPAYWTFTHDANIQQETKKFTEKWYLSNHDRAPTGHESWLDITFEMGFPASGLQDLLTIIQRREGGNILWRPLESPFVGWTSDDLEDDQEVTREIDYYLVERNIVIRLERYIDPKAEGPQDMIRILNSIDRYSAPPRVLFVKSLDKKSFQVGETACLKIEVDDLKGSFEDNSIRDIVFRGQWPHWAFKNIRWVPESNWFDVCVKVSSAFAADGLEVQNLKIENIRGAQIRCSFESKSSMLCESYQNEGDATRIPTDFPRVDNTNIDNHGPSITAMQWNPNDYRLYIDAIDNTGILGGFVESTTDITHFLNEGTLSWRIYADQIGSTGISLRQNTVRGWIILNKLVLFDANGSPTLLQTGDGLCPSVGQMSSSTYVIYEADGRCYQSDISVITFLNP